MVLPDPVVAEADAADSADEEDAAATNGADAEAAEDNDPGDQPDQAAISANLATCKLEEPPCNPGTVKMAAEESQECLRLSAASRTYVWQFGKAGR